MTDGLVEQMRLDVDELTRDGGQLDVLEELLPEPVVDPKTGTRSRNKVAASPAPWHVEAGDLLTTIHAGARDVEAKLAYIVLGTRRNRGSSSINTRYALDAIPDLAARAGKPHVQHAASDVASWVRAARQLRDIDQQERWEPLPRRPKSTPPPCPYCGTFSLRWSRVSGDVRCNNPSCVDEDEHRPRARMTVGRYSGEASLVWRDGREITYRPAGEG